MNRLKHKQIIIEKEDEQLFVLTANETDDFISVEVQSKEDFKKVILLINGKNVMTQEEFNTLLDQPTELVNESIKGIPRIKGTKIPISMVLSFLQEGQTIQQISENIGVKVEAVQEAIQYAMDKLNK